MHSLASVQRRTSENGRQLSGQGKFFYLLAAQVLMLLVLPWLGKATWASVFIRLLGAAALCSTIYAVSSRRVQWVTAVLLAIPAGFLNAVYAMHPREGIAIPTWLCTIAFLLYALVSLLRSVIRAREITADTIYGALTVYVLIGLVWGVCYILLVTTQPNAIAIDPTRHSSTSMDWFDCMFYSFVTLTTLGYGDMVPVTGPARSLSILEAICGIMYVAILVARLVGLYASTNSQSPVEIARSKALDGAAGDTP
jgi:Ion channel